MSAYGMFDACPFESLNSTAGCSFSSKFTALGALQLQRSRRYIGSKLKVSRISRNFRLQFCLQRLLDAVLTAHCLPLCNQPTCPSACSMNFAMAMCIVTCQVPQRAVQNCLSVDSLVIVPSSQVFRASASALMPSIAPWLTSSEFSG